MIKDRLAALKAAQSENGIQIASIPIPADDDHVVVVEDQPNHMEKFFAEVNEIREHIQRICHTSEEIRKRHSLLLSSTHVDKSVTAELEQLMEEIKRTANKVRSKLKVLEQSIKEDEQGNAFSADVRMRKMQYSAMSRQFVEAMFDHNQLQTDYRERCKQRIQRQLEITGRTMTEEELNNTLEQEDPSVFTQGIIHETQQARQALADLEARHYEFLKLEKSIQELHDSFLDMALLVENQGEMIDQIQFNVANAVDYVQTAKTKTTQAMKYQGKARKKKIMVIICLVITLVLVLTLGIGFGTNWGK